MMRFVSVTLLVLSVALDVCKADVYSWGRRLEYRNYTGNYHKYERQLIDDKNSVPKDYTIFYKYYGSQYKPVSYIEIDVNVSVNENNTWLRHHSVYEKDQFLECRDLTESDGYIYVTDISQEAFYGLRATIQVFNGRVSIKNALNVTVNLEIHGLGMISMPSMALPKVFSIKSVSYIHVKNSNRSLTRKKLSQNAIGTRRSGDELIHFESRNVRNQSRFPSRAFEYSGVEYITYVGFSFDSPTAIVMVNTSYVGEREFNAVVYDMNSEHFIANMSVYGMKSSIRPNNFLGVI